MSDHQKESEEKYIRCCIFGAEKKERKKREEKEKRRKKAGDSAVQSRNLAVRSMNDR